MSTTTVHGIGDLKAALASVREDLRKRVLRNALAAGARLVRNEARRLAPVLRAPIRRQRDGKLVRKPGTLQKALSVRTSKRARQQGSVGVFVNVRPAKGAKFSGGVLKRASQRGADSPDDPYYWQWLEFGRQGRAAQGPRQRVQRNKVAGIKGQRARRALRAVGPIAPMRFLQRGALKLSDALRLFEQQVGAEIAKFNRRKP